MQVSKKKINRQLQSQLTGLFYQVVADIGSDEEAKLFLDDFLTKTEMAVMVKRLAIAYYLKKGKSYQEIKNHLSVSSATISTVADLSKKHGFAVAFKKIANDEWADKWTQKIIKTFKIRA